MATPLSLRLLRRDARNGELWLLLLALVLAVAATTSLRFFSSSLEQGLIRQASSLIAADLVVSSSRGIRPEIVSLAEQYDLAQVNVTEFSSMIQSGDEFQLASIKAVTQGYPLRGELKGRLNTEPQDKTLRGIPPQGELWIDERLQGLLNAKIGDAVILGDVELRINAILTQEPDRGGNFAAFSPRAIMNANDIAAANVILPGARIHYRLQLAGTPKAINDFKDELKPQAVAGERIVDVASGRPEVGSPLARAADYLSLAAIAAVVLAGVAVAICARRFTERHFDAIALFRSFGASRKRVQSLYWQQLSVLWLLAIIFGAAIGLGTAYILFNLLNNLLPVSELEFAWQRPLLTGIATATLTLFGFALPAFISLFQVSPLRVLRRELAPVSLSAMSVTVLALISLFALLTLETGRWQLTATVVLGGALLIGIIAATLNAALKLWRNRMIGTPALTPWQQGLRELWRNPKATLTQLLGFSLGLSAMLIVTSLSGELLSTWQTKLPVNAPNQFAMGIPSEELPLFQETLSRHQIEHAGLYPVIRGRLVAINGEPVRTRVSKDDPEDQNTDNALNRELNLTWSDTLPLGNRLIEGQWWDAESANASYKPVSLEKELAQRLKLNVGDTLSFSLVDGPLEAQIVSIRELDWDTFQPNFYMVFPKSALADQPASYLTSFYVPTEKRAVLNTLVKTFPTMVLIDIDSVMSQIRTLLDQVTKAVEFVLLFVLLAGVLVLLACVAASLEARKKEAGLLRALGASKRQLQLRLSAEMIALGALSGLIAIAITEVIAAVLYIQVLEVSPRIHYSLWLLSPLLGALLTGLTGVIGARKVWQTSPLLALREN